MPHRHTVLIVDDDDDCREGLAALLSLDDIEARSVAGGREALAALRDGFAPCVILLDLRMPDLDGAGFLAAMQTDAPRIPVLLVTGNVAAAERARELGAQDIILKPIVPPTMHALIARHCGHSSAG